MGVEVGWPFFPTWSAEAEAEFEGVPQGRGVPSGKALRNPPPRPIEQSGMKGEGMSVSSKLKLRKSVAHRWRKGGG
jgi:hypothetical protein